MQDKTEMFKTSSQAYDFIAIVYRIDCSAERLMASDKVSLAWNAFLTSILPHTYLLKDHF